MVYLVDPRPSRDAKILKATILHWIFSYYCVASQGRITQLTALFNLQHRLEGSGDQEGFARRWISYWSKGWIQSLLALFFFDNILIYIWISQYWTIILRCCLLGVLGFIVSINGLVTGWESSGASEPFLRTCGRPPSTGAQVKSTPACASWQTACQIPEKLSDNAASTQGHLNDHTEGHGHVLW